jgi:hypothetical protein
MATDVGRVGLAGKFEHMGGVLTLLGAGGGVYIAGDGFHYVYQPLQGDFDITVRAVSLKNTVANSTLGLMARESLEYDARDVYLFLRPNRDYIAACQARVADDVGSVNHLGKETGIKFPHWLRMTRRDDRFETFLSPDGNKWRSLGFVENKLSKYLYVGLMVCSHRTSLLTEAVFDQVTLSGTTPSPERFKEEVAKTVKRASGEGPRDPRLNAFDDLAKKRRTERSDLVFPAKKKLISFSVPMPSPAKFRDSLTEFEKRPYEGLVLQLHGGQRPFQRKRWNESNFLEDYKALAETRSKVLTDNFLLLHTNATIDWFDEEQWQSVLHNTRLMAKAGTLGRCAGFFIDPEGYGSNAWSYYDAIGKDDKTFAQFHAQVKKRGEEWIRAIEAEMPAPRLLFAFFMPTTRLMDDRDWPIEKITADIPRMRYGLLPSFTAGILKGASPKTVLIEGNEHAYYYRVRTDYENYAHYFRELLPKTFLDKELWDQYSRQVKVGASLYTNWYFGTNYKSIAQHMTPDERARWYEHNLYWAFKAADEYVWEFAERPISVWEPDWTTKLPEQYLEANRSARQKVADNKPLGYDSSTLLDGVTTRAAQKRPKASVTKLTGKAPEIDGQLDDVAWKQAGFGFSFMPLMAWRQQGIMKTEASATWDDQALYIAVRCMEDRPTTMRAQTTMDDDYFLARDDHVQVLIASPKEPEKLFYRFLLSSHGKVNDAVIRVNPDVKGRALTPLLFDLQGFNPEWQRGAKVQAESWTAEIRIPWKSLGIEPQPGISLSINIGRFRSQGLNWERSYWAPVLEAKGDTVECLDPGLFGTVRLQGFGK